MWLLPAINFRFVESADGCAIDAKRFWGEDQILWLYHNAAGPGVSFQMSVPLNEDASDEMLAEAVSHRSESEAAMRQAAACFEHLYNRHSRLLLAFLSSRVVVSDLDDVHQAVWQKVWQNLPDYFRGGNFRAWLHQIARNHLIDLRRKRRPELLGESESNLEAADQGVDPLVDQERRDILTRCLQHLTTEMAEIVRRRLGGEEYSGICSVLGIEAARAHKLFFQAREQLTLCVQKVQG